MRTLNILTKLKGSLSRKEEFRTRSLSIKGFSFLKKNQIGKKILPLQDCPICGEKIPAISGSRDAICPNCGFKDSCC
jgi:hypothetical protein